MSSTLMASSVPRSSEDVCGPNDGNYACCDPTTPCPGLLDCWYEIDFDHPHGTCQPWDHCGDAAGVGDDAGLRSGCDGVWRATNHQPWGVNKTCEDAGVDAPASDGG